jgi:hypothetical protein
MKRGQHEDAGRRRSGPKNGPEGSLKSSPKSRSAAVHGAGRRFERPAVAGRRNNGCQAAGLLIAMMK